MRTILTRLGVAATMGLLTGCATTKEYRIDRGRDANDILTLTVGRGVGVKARVGFVQTGLLHNRDCAGLRSGSLFNSADLEPENYGNDDQKHNSEESEIGPVGVFGVPIAYFMPYWGDGSGIRTYRYYSTGNDQFRPLGIPKERGKQVDSWSSTFLVTHDNPQHLGQVEVVLGLGASVRFGFNAGELLDFLVGIFGGDIFDDDLAMRPFKEERRERRTAYRLLNTFESPKDALMMFNQDNAQDAPQGQAILKYVTMHPNDGEMSRRFTACVILWANAENSVKEMAEDQKAYSGKYSPNHDAFVYRAKYAFDTLQKLNLIHAGMTYDQAIGIFGTPTEVRRAEGTAGSAAWALTPPFGGGLLYQVQATVDSSGIVQSIYRTR
jgi:hypothetical protein